MLFSTISRKQINLTLFTARDVDIETIATGLSHICRFNGQCRELYTVAQHSILVCNLVPDELKLQALLHDAAEAYVGDMTRPTKTLFPDFRAFEKRLLAHIYSRYDLPILTDSFVEEMDNQLLRAEMKRLVPGYENIDAMPLDWSKIPPLEDAKYIFLDKFKQYGGDINVLQCNQDPGGNQ